MVYEDRDGDWQPLRQFLAFAANGSSKPSLGAELRQPAAADLAAELAQLDMFRPQDDFAPEDLPADPTQMAFLRGRCRWVDPDITKADAQALIDRLREDTLDGALTDEQMRQLVFFHIEYPRGVTNRMAVEILAKHMGENPGCDLDYRAWRKVVVDFEH